MIIHPRDITLDIDNCVDSCTDDITSTITTTITITKFNKAQAAQPTASFPTPSYTAPILDIVVEKRQFKSGSSQMITDTYSKSKGSMDAKTSTTLAIVIPICVLLVVSVVLVLFYYLKRKQSEDSINPQILKEIRETKPTTLYINKNPKAEPDQIRVKDIPAKKLEAVSGFSNWKRQSIFNVKDWLDKRMSRDVSIRHVASSMEESSSCYSEKDHHKTAEKASTPRGLYSQFYSRVINTPATNLRTFKLLNKSPARSGVPRPQTPDSCNFHPSFIRNILQSARDSTDLLPKPTIAENKDLPKIPLEQSNSNVQRQVIEIDTGSPFVCKPQVAKIKNAEQRATKKVAPLSLNGMENTVDRSTSALRTIYQVIENYTAKLPDEISIVKGELVILNGVFEDDWCRVNKVNSKLQGVVPRYCVARFT